jgi:hypothetical protein
MIEIKTYGNRHVVFAGMKGGVKISILALFTAVILLISSFTLSSCKDCSKSKPVDVEPAPPQIVDVEPGELSLEESRVKLDDVATRCVEIFIVACEAFNNARGRGADVKKVEGKRNRVRELVAQVEAVAKDARVVKAAASNPPSNDIKNNEIKNNAKAIIELLLVKARQGEVFATYAVAFAKYGVVSYLPLEISIEKWKADAKNTAPGKEDRAAAAQEALNMLDAFTVAGDDWHSTWKQKSETPEFLAALNAWNKMGMNIYKWNEATSSANFRIVGK